MVATGIASSVLALATAVSAAPPSDETVIAETFFTTTVADVAGETPTDVACVPEAAVYRPNSDDQLAGQPSVVSRCYGFTGNAIWTGQITHVGAQVTWCCTDMYSTVSLRP
jgi:hypothetical protein